MAPNEAQRQIEHKSPKTACKRSEIKLAIEHHASSLMRLKWATIAYLPLTVNPARPASALLSVWEHVASAMLACHRPLKGWLYGLPSCTALCGHDEWTLKIIRLVRERTDVSSVPNDMREAMGRLFCIVLHMTFLLPTGGRLVLLATYQQRRRALKLQASVAMTLFQTISGEGWEEDSKKKCRTLYGKC